MLNFLYKYFCNCCNKKKFINLNDDNWYNIYDQHEYVHMNNPNFYSSD